MMNDEAYDRENEYAARDYEYENRNRSRRKLYLWTGVCVAVAIIVIVVSVVFATKGRDEDASGVTKNGSGLSKSALSNLVSTAYANVGIDPAPLSTQNSVAWLALQWLSNDKLQTTEATVIIQRFALAAFYFATYSVANPYVGTPKPWLSSNLWLSDQSECGWEGVLCSPRGTVLGLSLESHGLSGAIPMELALLRDHLTTLDLTSNMLFMQDSQLDVFAKLTNIITFLLDDNFLTTTVGLPTQMAVMSNLAMARLSYNLLQGPLNGTMLTGFPQLTHLEVESNYITGTMPSEVGTLSSLIYFYFRRNGMNFNLDFVKSGKMTDLFAMWLDDNTITGTLPTQLALLTNLASLSLTNSSITGKIPSELAELTTLQRLWLYSNKLVGAIPTQFDNATSLSVFEVQHNELTGTVPSGLCTTIKSSSYAKKSLTCDCKTGTVNCTCCTTCY